MVNTEAALTLYRLMLWVALALTAAFMAVYQITSHGQWRKSGFGIQLMSMALCLLLLLLGTALQFRLAVSHVLWLGVVLYTFLSILMLNLIRVALRLPLIRRKPRKDEAKRPGDGH